MLILVLISLLIGLAVLLLILTLSWRRDQPISIDHRIGLQYIRQFLSEDECQYLIRLAEGHFTRSATIGPNGKEDTIDDHRTSSSYFLPDSDPVVQRIRQRAARILKVRYRQLEGLQVVKYEPGQYFNEHHDWFTPDYVDTIGDQREYTIFAYLNTADGQTEFPHLEKSFSPRRGDALKWKNCDSLNKCNDLSLHRGAPPQTGLKYGLNIWSRFR